MGCMNAKGTAPDKVNLILKHAAFTKTADGQKLADIAQKCAEEYMKFHDKDKDMKLSREEAT